MAPNKQASEDRVFDLIDAKFGKNTISQLGDVPAAQYDVISTGSLGLDHALGIGGLPLGRIVEIYGPESSGKTTLTLHVLANAQKNGCTCAFIDAEHALDVRYAAALGVDVGDLWVSQPDYGEQALEVVDMLAQSGQVDVVIVDSVAALTPKVEIEGEVGDVHVGVHARMMSQALRKIVAAAHRTNTMIVFINQLRTKIGVKFGSPETTTGGNALKFYASVRLDSRRIGGVKEGTGENASQVANRTRVKVKKNKVAPPFTEAEFNIEFGQGIDNVTELLELGVSTKVIQKSGSWLSWGDVRLGQGRMNVAKSLRENKELLEKLSATVRDKLEGTNALALSTKEAEEPEKKTRKKPQKTSTKDSVAKLMSRNPPGPE